MMAATGKRLLVARTHRVGDGTERTTGHCPLCGRKVTRSMSTKTGGTCRYDGARFDVEGWHIGYAPTRKRVVPCAP